jgi:hypothetical protein
VRPTDVPIWLAMAAASLAWVGCTDRVEHPAAAEAASAAFVSGDDETAVARVDGRAISVAEMMSQWRKSPERARRPMLETLVDRDIAAHRLVETGHLQQQGLRRDLGLARKSAMVRALLEREIESAVTAEDLDAEAVDERMEVIRRQVGRPRGLQASHLLVSVPDDAEPPFDEAKNWLERIAAKLGDRAHLQDLYTVAEGFERKLPNRLEIIIDPHLVFPLSEPDEQRAGLPDGWSNVVEPFRKAASSLVADAEVFEAMETAESGRTPTSAPVRSKYGWHVIVPERILAAKEPEEGPLRELATRELLREKRRHKLRTWMADLASRTDIVRFKDNLSDDQE